MTNYEKYHQGFVEYQAEYGNITGTIFMPSEIVCNRGARKLFGKLLAKVIYEQVISDNIYVCGCKSVSVDDQKLLFAVIADNRRLVAINVDTHEEAMEAICAVVSKDAESDASEISGGIDQNAECN